MKLYIDSGNETLVHKTDAQTKTIKKQHGITSSRKYLLDHVHVHWFVARSATLNFRVQQKLFPQSLDVQHKVMSHFNICWYRDGQVWWSILLSQIHYMPQTHGTLGKWHKSLPLNTWQKVVKPPSGIVRHNGIEFTKISKKSLLMKWNNCFEQFSLQLM